VSGALPSGRARRRTPSLVEMKRRAKRTGRGERRLSLGEINPY